MGTGMIIRHDDAFVGAGVFPSFGGELPPQVLVVDDAVEIRECLGYLLRAEGFRMLAAEDGLAAQVILKLEHPSLVISDLEMPVCDGWELLEYCHSHHPDLPVLIVSGGALGRRPEIERFASAILPKPFSFLQFRAEVRRLVLQAA